MFPQPMRHACYAGKWEGLSLTAKPELRGMQCLIWTQLASSAWFNSLPLYDLCWMLDTVEILIRFELSITMVSLKWSQRHQIAIFLQYLVKSDWVTVPTKLCCNRFMLSCFVCIWSSIMHNNIVYYTYIYMYIYVYMHRESLKDASGGKWRCSQEKNECSVVNHESFVVEWFFI